MEKRQVIPAEMVDAFLLAETGWPPDVLDNVAVDRLERLMLYKAVRAVAEGGGELRL